MPTKLAHPAHIKLLDIHDVTHECQRLLLLREGFCNRGAIDKTGVVRYEGQQLDLAQANGSPTNHVNKIPPSRVEGVLNARSAPSIEAVVDWTGLEVLENLTLIPISGSSFSHRRRLFTLQMSRCKTNLIRNMRITGGLRSIGHFRSGGSAAGDFR